MKILTALPFSLIAIIANAQPQKIVIDKIIATVGDRIVLQSDVLNLLEDDKRHNAGVSRLTPCNSIDEIVANKILLYQAENDNISIDDDELENQLDRTVRYYVQQLHGEAEFEKQAGKSIEAFKEESRNNVKDKMLAEAMLASITGKIKITPSEVADFFNSMDEKERPFIETRYVIDQLVYYPQASKEMHDYVVKEMRKYKEQANTGTIAFDRLASLYPELKQSNYQLKRNDKAWDERFLSAVFRLREGEISEPLKSGNIYYLAKMVSREGDNAVVQLIAKSPSVTEIEYKQALAHIDTVRAKIIAGTISFNEAVSKFSNDDDTKYSISVLNEYGQPSLTIAALDKEVVKQLSNLNAGQVSAPISFRDKQNRMGIKIICLRSKTNPHVQNLKDDYADIASQALAIKKNEALKKWIEAKKAQCSIVYDRAVFAECIAGIENKEISAPAFGF